MNHKEHGCYFSETASVSIHKFHQRALEVGLFHKQFGRWNSGEKRERERVHWNQECFIAEDFME